MHAFIVIHGFKGSASFMCVYDRYWYFTFLTLCYLLSILNDGVRQAAYFNCSTVNCDWNRHAGTIEHMFYGGHQLNLIQEQHVSINGTAAWPNTSPWLWHQGIMLYLASFPSCTETILMTKYEILFSLFVISLQH